MGCATSENAHRFDAECDLLTGTSKPLAESGRGDPVALPAGLTMSTRLEGYSETRDQAPVAHAKTGIVFLDPKSKRPVAVPEQVHEW